jgi:hypothetical protein
MMRIATKYHKFQSPIVLTFKSLFVDRNSFILLSQCNMPLLQVVEPLFRFVFHLASVVWEGMKSPQVKLQKCPAYVKAKYAQNTT